MKQTYPVAYKVVPLDPPATKEQLQEAGLGGADALLIFSILFPADGSRSELILSHDGRTREELDDSEQFKCLIGLAHKLSQSKTLGAGRKEFARQVFETARQAILAARREAGTL